MKTIGIYAHSFFAGSTAMFDTLGKALDVRFQERTFGDDRDIDAWVVLGADRKFVSEMGGTTCPCYVVLADAELISCGASSRIKFTDRSELTRVLRGRDVSADDAVGAKALPQWLSDVAPLALKDGSAVWAVQNTRNCHYHYCSLSPPELNEAEPLFLNLCGQRFARLLPLVMFLRSVNDDDGWEPPPLQAAFMFDDPNLHWTSYGFIDYAEIVRQAIAANYHVSIATIPLDAWFVHPPASAMFRENSNRISLLCHGNDHVSNELGRSRSSDAMRRLLLQAVGRIAKMEARTGLEVARVMAPPHGACSETAISEMARLGFEAVCVSRGSLRRHNTGAAWTRTIGLQPCNMVAGLPVIPRFGLSKNCHNDILIAAVLGQPIVPMTHHEAVADGYDLLNEAASFVNSLGDVAWRDMKTVARALYSQRRDNRTLWVKMWSKRITVRVPAGTTQMRVERHWLQNSVEEALSWRASSDDSWTVLRDQETLAVHSGMTIEIASGRDGARRSETEVSGRRRLAPVARRVLTEVRDRALPSIRRIAPKR
jgi:hypothetical protein